MPHAFSQLIWLRDIAGLAGGVTPAIADVAAASRTRRATFAGLWVSASLLGARIADGVMEDLERPEGSRDWTATELARRGIVIRPDREKYEGYGQASYDLLKRVRLQLNGHACWSRTADSVLAATVVDPRFQNDPELPNRWFALARTPSGQATTGPPHPYYGAGFYVKLTRLASPPGALFAEYHLAFGEPNEWFGSANLLGSKLPAIVQSQVRSVRRELLVGPKPSLR